MKIVRMKFCDYLHVIVIKHRQTYLAMHLFNLTTDYEIYDIYHKLEQSCINQSILRSATQSIDFAHNIKGKHYRPDGV